MASPGPKISIVTVVYNGVASLESTIQSIINLDYPNVEYIVIDGGSTDGTLEILKKYSHRITYQESGPDKGIYDAMNKGIDKATGRWTIFINSADRVASPGAFSNIDWSMEADIIYGNAIKEYPHFTMMFPVLPLDKSWKDMPFCHNASFTRTDLLKSRKFDTKYKLSADFDFVYHAFLDGKKFVQVPTVVTLFDYKQGASLNHGLRSIRERRDSVLQRNASVAKSLYFYALIARYKVAEATKKLVGKKVTAWLTRLLRT